jgi:hypothetical protein
MNGWTRAGRIIERIADNVVRVEFQHEPGPPTPRFPGAGAMPAPPSRRFLSDDRVQTPSRVGFTARTAATAG